MKKLIILSLLFVGLCHGMKRKSADDHNFRDVRARMDLSPTVQLRLEIQLAEENENFIRANELKRELIRTILVGSFEAMSAEELLDIILLYQDLYNSPWTGDKESIRQSVQPLIALYQNMIRVER